MLIFSSIFSSNRCQSNVTSDENNPIYIFVSVSALTAPLHVTSCLQHLWIIFNYYGFHMSVLQRCRPDYSVSQ